MSDQSEVTIKQFKNVLYGMGSWKANRKISMYPVNKYGSTISKISIGINDIAVPIKTILIVEMMGVTLFLENDEKARHSEETVIITKLENMKLKKNLQMISSSDSKRIPL
jgi:hypothetical protein